MRSVRLPSHLSLCSAPCQHWVVLAANNSESYQFFLCANASDRCDGARRFRLDHLLPTDWTALLRECRARTGPRGSFNFSFPGYVISAAASSASLSETREEIPNAAVMHIFERREGDFVPKNMLYHPLQQIFAVQDSGDFSAWLRKEQSASSLAESAASANAQASSSAPLLSADANDPLALDAAALEKTAQNEYAVSGVPRFSDLPRVFTFFPHTISLADCVPYHTPHFAVLVNLRPIVSGDLMLVPVRCVATIHALRNDELEDFGRVMQLTLRVAAQHAGAAATAGGFSVAVQQGALSGQTVPHLHVHVIPFDPRGKLAGEPEMEDAEQCRRESRTAAEMREETETLRPIFKELAQKLKREDASSGQVHSLLQAQI